jgi:hypothetical protein
LIVLIGPSVPQQDTAGKQTRRFSFPNKFDRKSSVTWQRLINLADYAYLDFQPVLIENNQPI